MDVCTVGGVAVGCLSGQRGFEGVHVAAITVLPNWAGSLGLLIADIGLSTEDVEKNGGIAYGTASKRIILCHSSRVYCICG